jgi:hypothetical protein
VVERSDATGTMAHGTSHPGGMPEACWHPAGMRDDWRDAFLSGGGAALTTG